MVWVPDPVTAALLGNGADINPVVTLLMPTQTLVVPVEESQSQVVYDIGSAQVRQASLTVDRALVDAGLFNPLTDRVYVRLQVQGGQDIPLFMGRVNTLQDTETGLVSVSCMDVMDDVNGYNFIVPWSTAGPRVSDELTRLIQDVNLSFAINFVNVNGAADPPVVAQVWEDDRVSAVQQLVQGMNCLIQSDRTGGFIVYLNPFFDTTPDSVATFQDGVNGTIVTMTHTTSRADIYNAITLVVERTDNTVIRVTVYDNDPQSLTLFGGSFGKKNRTIKLQTPINQSQAYRVALRVLRQSLALSESWQWSTPCNPLLDPGDVATMWYRNVVAPVMIESITFPLVANAPTQFTGRRLQLLDPSLVGIV